MITKSQPAHTLLPSFMLVACGALPGGAAAQTPPPTTGTSALSAAMAEALRSPFYASSGADEFTILRPVGVPTPHAGYQSAPDSADRPSFHRVFWPTLGVGVLSWLGAAWVTLPCALRPSACSDAEAEARSLASLTALVLVPPITGKIAGGSFTRGVLGSAGGFAVGLLLSHVGQESSAFFALPIVHVLSAAAFSAR